MQKTKKKTQKKSKIKYEYGSKYMQETYEELKDLLEKGLIKDFWLPKPKDIKSPKNKYRAKKCIIDGQTVDSIAEARFYIYLIKQLAAHKIKCFEFQPKFLLLEGFEKLGKKIRATYYISDFLVTYPDDSRVAYDVKGRITAVFSLKKKLFDQRYKDLPLVCVKEEDESWVELHTNKKLA